MGPMGRLAVFVTFPSCAFITGANFFGPNCFAAEIFNFQIDVLIHSSFSSFLRIPRARIEERRPDRGTVDTIPRR